VSLVGVVGFFLAMLSIFLGGGATYLYWTDQHRPLVLPISLLGLVLGNLVLIVDWLRDRARFSLSVVGLTLSLVSLLTAFVDEGGVARTEKDLRRAIASFGKTTKGPADPTGPTGGAAVATDDAKAGSPAAEEPTPGSSTAPGRQDVRGGMMTKAELVAKIEALGNPCPREALFKAVGSPGRTQTTEGRLAGLAWVWKCKDGEVEVILLNPEFRSGEHTDNTLAYISKINVN